MLHTFSHLLIRELALECGYNAASIRERIYAAAGGDTPMAGILLYTAAADSDGTLGGLVELAKPESLGRMIEQALARAAICSSDPLCSEHDPEKDRSLHPQPVMLARLSRRRLANAQTAIWIARSSSILSLAVDQDSSAKGGAPVCDLWKAVAELTTATHADRIAAVADAVAALASVDQFERLRHAFGPSADQTLVNRLQTSWRSAREVTPQAVSAAFRASAHVVSMMETRGALELVWTGPKTGLIPTRQTEQVMIEVIDSARSDLFIVSYVFLQGVHRRDASDVGRCSR